MKITQLLNDISELHKNGPGGPFVQHKAKNFQELAQPKAGAYQLIIADGETREHLALRLPLSCADLMRWRRKSLRISGCFRVWIKRSNHFECLIF